MKHIKLSIILTACLTFSSVYLQSAQPTWWERSKNYTVFVDGISKSLAATGVRVGWSMGPKLIIDKMKAILTHVGAWAPKAEQMATAKYLSNLPMYDAF